MNKMRKATAGGLTALLAATALSACGDAPEESSSSSGDTTASDFLPCIVSDAGGFDDKSFNQLSHEGVEQAADELGVEFKDVESNSENDFAPNIESLVAEGCDTIVTVGFALAAATKEAAEANPDLEVRPDRRRCRRWRRRCDLRRQGRPAEHQAPAVQHRPGGLHGRLRRGGLLQDRRGRHLRRPAVPDRHDLHGRLQAGRRVLQQGEGQERQGRRLGRQGRLLHRWLRGQRDGHQHRAPAARPGRRRDPAGRRPDLPGRADRHRRLRRATSRCWVWTPTSSRPTRTPRT